VKTVIEGNSIWIQFKDMNLSDFFYVCRKLGGTSKGCDHYEEGMHKTNLYYSGWLRASPLKLRRRNVEVDLAEDRMLFLAFQNKNKSSLPRKS